MDKSETGVYINPSVYTFSATDIYVSFRSDDSQGLGFEAEYKVTSYANTGKLFFYVIFNFLLGPLLMTWIILNPDMDK